MSSFLSIHLIFIVWSITCQVLLWVQFQKRTNWQPLLTVGYSDCLFIYLFIFHSTDTVLIFTCLFYFHFFSLSSFSSSSSFSPISSSFFFSLHNYFQPRVRGELPNYLFHEINYNTETPKPDIYLHPAFN